LIDARIGKFSTLGKVAKGELTGMREMFQRLVTRFSAGQPVTVEELMKALGVQGGVFDVTTSATVTKFSDDAKSEIFLSTAVTSASKCPECGGLMFPRKSASYDHLVRVRDAGMGDAGNGQMMHPYCNSAIKN
jgi:hypothetical protein